MGENYPFDQGPDETDEEFEQRQREEAKSSSDLLTTIAGLVYTVLKFGIIYCLFLYFAFLLTKHFWGRETTWWKIGGLTLMLTYFMVCIIYFLKGIMVSLRASKNRWWIVLWVICVIITCIPPIIITETLIMLLFSFRNQQLLSVRLFAWGIGLLVGLYTYTIYQFLIPGAPPIFYWSFAVGLRLGKKM